MMRSPKKNEKQVKGDKKSKSKKKLKHGGAHAVEESSDLGFVSADSSVQHAANGTGSLSRGNSTKSRTTDGGVDGLMSPVKSLVRKSYDHALVLSYEEIVAKNLDEGDPNVTIELMKSMGWESPNTERRNRELTPQSNIPVKYFNDLNNSSTNGTYIADIPLEHDNAVEHHYAITSAVSRLENEDDFVMAGYSSLERSFSRKQAHSQSFRHRRDPKSEQKWRYRSLRSSPCSPHTNICETNFVNDQAAVPTALLQKSFSPGVQSTPKRTSRSSFNGQGATSFVYPQDSMIISPGHDADALNTSTLGELPSMFDKSSILDKSSPGPVKVSVSALKARLEQKLASNSTLNSRSSDLNVNLIGKPATRSSVRDIIKRFESGTIANPLTSPTDSPIRTKSSTMPGRNIVSMYNPTEMELRMVRSETMSSHISGSEPSLFTEDRFTISNGTSEPLPVESKYVHISCSASGYPSVRFKSPGAEENSGTESADENDDDMGAKHSKRGKTPKNESAAKTQENNEANKAGVDTSNVVIDFVENKENIAVNGNHLKSKPESNGNSKDLEDKTRRVTSDSKTKDDVINVSKTNDAEINTAASIGGEDTDTANAVSIGRPDTDTVIADSIGESTSEDKKETCPLNDSFSKKDGNYFLKVVEFQVHQLQSSCRTVESYMNEETLSEDASGKIRAAVGKANLLISKKFEQFKSLCHKNLTQSDDEPFKTTSQDLAGFWDMVELQVGDVNSEFTVIEKMKNNNWVEPVQKVQRVRRSSSGSSQKGSTTETTKSHSKTSTTGARGKTPTKLKDATTKSTTKSTAKASREEARKRLIAAKRAMRHRISSGEEVEIFLPESTH